MKEQKINDLWLLYNLLETLDRYDFKIKLEKSPKKMIFWISKNDKLVEKIIYEEDKK